MKALLPFVGPHLAVLALATPLLLLANGVYLAVPYLVGRVVAEVSGETPGPIAGVDRLAATLGCVLVLRAILYYGQASLFISASHRVTASVRRALYRKLIGQSAAFFDQRRTGELTSRLTNDVSRLESALSVALSQFLRRLVILAFGIAVVTAITPRLAVFVLFVVPLAALLAVWFGRLIRKKSRETQDALAKTNTAAEEALSTIEVVKAHTNEEYELARYFASVTDALALALQSGRIRSALASLVGLVIMGAGMDTVLGDRGVQLSGGQRQRIGIARAVLRDAPVLLLDEATSSLDSEGERLVQDALRDLTRDRTSPIVAHRLSTIRDVDRVMVLHGGRIVETGAHADLARIDGGFYSRLVQLQALEDVRLQARPTRCVVF